MVKLAAVPKEQYQAAYDAIAAATPQQPSEDADDTQPRIDIKVTDSLTVKAW